MRYLVTKTVYLNRPFRESIYWKPSLMSVDEVFEIFWGGDCYLDREESTEEFKTWVNRNTDERYRIHNEKYEVVENA